MQVILEGAQDRFLVAEAAPGRLGDGFWKAPQEQFRMHVGRFLSLFSVVVSEIGSGNHARVGLWTIAS